MSTYTTPIDAMFETQRSAIKGSQEATKQAASFQKSMNRMAVSGTKGQESTQRQGVELLQAGTRSYLSAVGAMTPGARGSTQQLQRQADELFAQLKSSHAELFETLTEEAERGASSYEELAEEYLEATDEALDALLDAHENVQSGTTEATDEYEERSAAFAERFEEAMDESMQQAEEFAERLEDAFETQVEGAEEFQQQFDAQAGASQADTRA
jgi:hypothetical protein